MSLSARFSQRILFKPARSSRHRLACFALYRALVRSALLVPLPDDLPGRGPANPIQRAIRRQFARNRNDVSKRLVFSALAAGYRFLDLFAKARDPASREHAEIVQHLLELDAEAERSRLNNPRTRIPPRNPTATVAQTTPPSPPVPTSDTSPSCSSSHAPSPSHALPSRDDNVPWPDSDLRTDRDPPSRGGTHSRGDATPRNPLLRLVRPGGPDLPPLYTRARPMRPASELKSRRHVPRLVVSANGIPFLRFGKPQPPWLSIYIRRRLRLREGFADTILSLEQELTQEAEWEDQWERIVDQAIGRLGIQRNVGVAAATTTFIAAIREARRAVQRRWSLDTEDLASQAHAMQQIIDEETAARDAEDKAGLFFPEEPVPRDRRGRKIPKRKLEAHKARLEKLARPRIMKYLWS